MSEPAVIGPDLRTFARERGYGVIIAQFEDGQTVYLTRTGQPAVQITRLWDEGWVIEAAFEWLADKEPVNE